MYPGAFGERLGRSFRRDDAPVLRAETQRGFLLAVTEIRVEEPGYGITGPMGLEDAYLICLNFLAQTSHELWYNGQSVCSNAYPVGSIYVIDLRCAPVTYVGDPLHSLYFYVPRDALREATGRPSDQDAFGLAIAPCQCIQDAIIYGIGQALLPIFGSRNTSHRQLVEHLLHGLCVYIANEYGGSTQKPAAIVRGALPQWQQRVATQMMRERVLEGVSVTELAEACGISVGAFSRGFKKGTGLSPHHWLVSRRLEVAMKLMADPYASLADVACSAGFSDQSHLTRVFTKRMGVTPGTWRKSVVDIRRAIASSDVPRGHSESP